jgi:hypothetical protein
MSTSPQREHETEEGWELPPESVNWDEVVDEARRHGCSVADVLYGRHELDAA